MYLQGEPDCWTFVEGLRWLQPSLATSPPFRPTLQKPSPSSSPRDEARESRYSDWLYRRYCMNLIVYRTYKAQN
jgi:hypothetical protein